MPVPLVVDNHDSAARARRSAHNPLGLGVKRHGGRRSCRSVVGQFCWNLPRTL